MKYEYLISYEYDRGSGRFFATCNDPIASREAVEELERKARREYGYTTFFISSFALLRTLEDESETQA